MKTNTPPPYKQCGRNACANMVETARGQKYCSDKCRRNAMSNRRKNRRDTPLQEAVEANTSFTFQKLKKSAIYLSETYKMDRAEVLEMLVDDMERKFDEFWAASEEA